MVRIREEKLRGHYDNLDYYSPLDHLTLQQIADTVDCPLISPVLDVGCGDGRLAKRNPHLQVVGVDYNKHRAAKAGAIHADLYEYLETCTDSYGTVVFVEVLEHLEDPLDAVEFARRLGPVLATVPIDLPYHAHLHVWPHIVDVELFFKPDRIAQVTRHAVLYWSKHDTSP